MTKLEKAINEMNIGLSLIEQGNKKVKEAKEMITSFYDKPVKEKKSSLTQKELAYILRN